MREERGERGKRRRRKRKEGEKSGKSDFEGINIAKTHKQSQNVVEKNTEFAIQMPKKKLIILIDTALYTSIWQNEIKDSQAIKKMGKDYEPSSVKENRKLLNPWTFSASN